MLPSKNWRILFEIIVHIALMIVAQWHYVQHLSIGNITAKIYQISNKATESKIKKYQLDNSNLWWK